MTRWDAPGSRPAGGGGCPTIVKVVPRLLPPNGSGETAADGFDSRKVCKFRKQPIEELELLLRFWITGLGKTLPKCQRPVGIKAGFDRAQMREASDEEARATAG